MIEDYRMWRHIFKLDPNKPIDDESLEKSVSRVQTQ